MAKAGKVHHWKHGWIPLDAYARNIVASRGRKRDVVGRAAVLDRPDTKIGTLDDWPESKQLTGLPKINGPHRLADDVIATNPGYMQGLEYQVNCAHCVNAWELRRRGFDVTATPLPEPFYGQNGRSVSEILGTDWEEPRDGGMPAPFQAVSVNGAKNIAASWPDGARGWVMVNWKNGAGGHVFAVEKDADGVHWVDPQNFTQDASHYFDRTVGPVKIARVDDLAPLESAGQFVTEPTSQQRMIIARRRRDVG